jgi:hypothetical protein
MEKATIKYVAPIPRDHLAKLAGLSWEWIRRMPVDDGRIRALELIQDENTLESVFVPYTSKMAKPRSLFIDPSVAAHFIKAHKGPGHVKEGTPFVPVPMSHLAKRVGCAVGSLFAAAREERLKAFEFIFDEEKMESTMRPYLLRSTPHQGVPVYVLPAEAYRFIKVEQLKRDDILEHVEIEPDCITKELELKVLEAARFVKAHDEHGIVVRWKVLERISGKRNNMYLLGKIRYILDQHIDEFPPHRSGIHAFLSRKDS